MTAAKVHGSDAPPTRLTKPSEWVVISGTGGLGHVAIQYAKALGLRVAAVDLGPEKMALARRLGGEIAIDAKTGTLLRKSKNKSAGRMPCL